ncbi:MAG: DUF499 domain-containing protein [Spiribacter salinus]|uniref:DUF499 domain-containing protein n=1 Tax=Spiribacter salinus TaxID=1335746 RepID=A0A540VQ08_9GAMM|nr:MAG: DUF499 domain-containing protein [Spiribacter salinus]
MLKTVKSACELHPGTLEYQSASGVESLNQILETDDRGKAFFSRNYMTNGMEALLSGGLKRLAGNSDQAVFELAQAMGGGKTHLMAALGLLAKYPEHRKELLPDNVLAEVGSVTARVAVVNGRDSLKTYPWGEIAHQLGDHAVATLKHCWEGTASAPGRDEWQKAIGDEPALILIDELPPYFDYAATRIMGNGTLADVVTRAIANLFEAALSLPNCCVVISNLSNTYTSESSNIAALVGKLQSEANRQATTITPVSLDGDEIYNIIRKRLFSSLPDENTIGEVAEAFAEQIRKAEDGGYFTARSMVQVEEEIRTTYPFHPSFKHLVALFKDNKNFRETRGLLEFSARVVRSVWNRSTDDVYLIGTQHLDLNDPKVSGQVEEIHRGLRNAVARDIADDGSSHAEAIDDQLNSDAGSQAAALILSSSLSESVRGHAGLHEHELIEYLIDPQRKPDEFKTAIAELRKTAWYLHSDGQDNLLFKDTENLIQRIQRDASNLSQDKVDEGMRKWLERELEPKSQKAYQTVLVMPRLDEIAEAIKQHRVLVIAKPDGSTPPEDIERFFAGIEHKNHLLVLTGHDSHMLGSVEDAFRRLKAIERIQKEISGSGNEGQIREARELYESTEETFVQGVQSVFNRLYFPAASGLASAVIDNGLKLGSSKEASPETQLEKFLASTRCDQKLVLDMDPEMDALVNMAEEMLWRQGQKREPWKDVRFRAASNPEWPWLPGRKGLDTLKSHAISRGQWREGADGYIEHGPFEKEKTTVSVTTKTTDDDNRELVLQLVPRNAGNTPRVHYSKHASVSESDPVVPDLEEFRTREASLYFLAVDPEGEHPTGSPVAWKATIRIRREVHQKPDHREVELQATPDATMRFTVDGTNPRDGTEYTGPFEIGDEQQLLQVYAFAGEAEGQESFKIQAGGDSSGRPQLDRGQPARLHNTVVRLDNTESVFDVIATFRDRKASFDQVRVTVGDGEDAVELNFNSRSIDAGVIETVIETLRKVLGDEEAPVSMMIRNGGGEFATGDDLLRFAEIAGKEITHDIVSQ